MEIRLLPGVSPGRQRPGYLELTAVATAWSAAGGPNTVVSIVELGGGGYNSSFRLTDGDGMSAVLRVAPPASGGATA